MKMNNNDDNSFSNKKYYDMLGINTEENFYLYYDESNNCRKFWLDSEKNNFNHDFKADFVLAGVASESNLQIPFEEIRERLELQKNAVELKSKSLFHGKDFLQCLKMKQVTALLKLFSEYELYMHYLHVNNFYYTIVEIFDSITDPKEIYNCGFDYFMLKTTFYNMLFPNVDKVIQTMIKYSYPNIKTDKIEGFCNDLINSIELKNKPKPDETFILNMLKRASKSSEMIFIQNNEDWIMQENYAIFYANSIIKFPKAIHRFDEELSIQSKVSKMLSIYNDGVIDYEFINSKNNTMIQLSDLVAGLLAKMFTFINSISDNSMLKVVTELNDTQLINCINFNKLRMKSDSRNKGLLQSITAIGTLNKLNCFFDLVELVYAKRC